MLPGKKSDRGCTAADNRLFVETVLWVARTGDAALPKGHKGGTCRTGSARGTVSTSGLHAGRMPKCGSGCLRSCARTLILKMSSLTARLSVPTSIRGGCAQKKGEQALGRSRGGLSAKTHAVVSRGWAAFPLVPDRWPSARHCPGRRVVGRTSCTSGVGGQGLLAKLKETEAKAVIRAEIAQPMARLE
jgi:hypothetical protein